MFERIKDSKMKHLLFTLLFVAFTTCTFVATTECAWVTTSVIQDCLQDEDGLNCEEKMVVGATVSYGLTTTIDAVTVSKSEVQAETLEETIRLEITKTQTKIIYPLTYLHTVLYYPPGPEVKFDGFEIKDHIRTYEIKIKLIKGSEVGYLYLTPEKPVDASMDELFKVKAELIGDFPAHTDPPELDNYILYVPSAPVDHPFVEDYQNNMLLVPREEASKFADECNKVGVSPTLGQECFHNKLFDKHNGDLQKLVLNPNAETTYLIHGMKKFKGSMSFKTGMEKHLEYGVTEISNAQIALTMDKAEIKVINTQSIGIIKEAYVETFDSMSREGTLKVVIKNVGDFMTDYIVTVTDIPVLPGGVMNIVDAIPAQARTFQIDQTETLTFDVYTHYNVATTHEFKVTLRSPTGHEYDSIWVVFDTEKYKVNQPPVADAGGPYEVGCSEETVQIQLDGTASYDPDDGDTIASYVWTTDCPCATFADPEDPDNPFPETLPSPVLLLDSDCGACCTVTLEVRDRQGVKSVDSTTVSITDGLGPGDADGDGVPDDVDACPNSDLSPTVVIDGCDTGVQNHLSDEGCTISDRIAQCAAGAKNHGQFVSCVANITNVLKRAGIITGKEEGEIQKCAAKANIP